MDIWKYFRQSLGLWDNVQESAVQLNEDLVFKVYFKSIKINVKKIAFGNKEYTTD